MGNLEHYYFFSKKLCEKFLARESLIVQTRYKVFGLTQLNLRSFIMMADCFASNFLFGIRRETQPQAWRHYYRLRADST
jgi:hypothetical protein